MKAILWVSICSVFFALGCSSKQISSQVLLENQTPVSTSSVTENAPNAYKPLACEAVGVAKADGSFQPIMYLGMPLPHGGGEYPIRLTPGNSFKVYRGTNQIAAKNLFLGEFKVQNASLAEGQASIDFEISDKHELFVSASADAAGDQRLKIEKISSEN